MVSGLIDFSTEEVCSVVVGSILVDDFSLVLALADVLSSEFCGFCPSIPKFVAVVNVNSVENNICLKIFIWIVDLIECMIYMASES